MSVRLCTKRYLKKEVIKLNLEIGKLEKFLGGKVFLTTYVKVKEDWRDRPNLLREYGYEDLKNV